MVTVLPSLPTLDVYVAFNPNEGSTALFSCQGQALPASGASNSYWTNIANGKNVLSFTTNSGKQHYLDRVEPGTMSMVVNNRDGFFTNGSVNGSGYVLDSRCPIAVTLTWSGTTYPAFFGLTDQITETIENQNNSTLTIQASDFLKQLSLKYMSSTNFWPTYANSTSAANWYRMDATQTAVVTNATSTSTTATFTAFNSFSTGQNVTITGLAVTSGFTNLNLQNVTIATASASGFTVTGTFISGSTSQGTGSAFRTAILDQIGSNNGNYIGPVSFPIYGAMIYDTDACVDVGNGGPNANAFVRLPNFSGTQGALDFWVLGQGIAGGVLTIVESTGSTQIELLCSATGYLLANVLTVGTVPSTVQINDGFWHHVGLVSNSSGILTLYVDGQFFTGSALSGLTGWKSAGTNTVIPASIGAGAPSMYVDEVVVSNTSSLSTLENEVKSRYRAGTLLQLPTNPTQSSVLSGDRIAEVLCIAGFGVITNGAVVLNSNLYYINNGSAWVNGTSGNGLIDVEPFYWDTPVTTSTALDLIGEITDTDIGNFFQKPDGTFNFFNQNFYGTWSWSGTSGTWTPNSYTPTGAYVWTDDATSNYNYEISTQVVRDDADTWTMVQITPQAGTMQEYENVSAEERYGYAVLTKASTLHPTLNAALSTANFLGYLFRSPLPRVQSVELNSTNGNGSNNVAICGTKLGDVINFVRTMPNASTSGTYPAQRGGINTNMIVESIQLDYQADPGILKLACELDPYPIRS